MPALPAAVLLASSGLAVALDEPSPTCRGLEPGPVRTVGRIIDAETLALDDGSQLRLIGALSPRAGDAGAEPGTWPPEIAAMEELRALLLAKSVELAFGGERTDRHGRLQAHAFLPEGERRRWVQGHLVAQGLARAYVQSGNRACAEALLAAEQEAREARRGLWAEAAYRIRPAERPAELSRYRSTFQVVEGRIARVAQVRGIIYLNFDRDWRSAFAVSLRGDDRGLLGIDAGAPKALEGRRVRVRGWIEQRRGPAIELSTAGLIEILEAAGSAAGTAQPPRDGARSRSRVPPRPHPQLREPDAKTPGLVETGR